MADNPAQLEILNSVDHADIKVILDRSAQFGDAVMQVMAFPFEFRNLQASYPIFFQVDRNDNLYPIALLGFEDGENLFLEEPNWKASYIPAMLRREPFAVGLADAQDIAGEQRAARLLSVDLNHPRLSRDRGEALFDGLGSRTTYLEDQADLLETLHDGLDHCQGFGQALREEGLVEAVTLEVTLNDGSQNQLVGLSSIDEDKVKELSGDALERLNQQGYLMPMFMAIASMSNVAALIELKNDRVEAGR